MSRSRTAPLLGLILLPLALCLTLGANFADLRLKTLTVVNKSGMEIEILLNGSDADNHYYLRIPMGDRSYPYLQKFTVVPDEYSATLYYVELWDPVYGIICSSKSQTLDLTRNVRLVVLECDRRAAAPGEAPAIIKFGVSGKGRGPR